MPAKPGIEQHIGGDACTGITIGMQYFVCGKFLTATACHFFSEVMLFAWAEDGGWSVDQELDHEQERLQKAAGRRFAPSITTRRPPGRKTRSTSAMVSGS